MIGNRIHPATSVRFCIHIVGMDSSGRQGAYEMIRQRWG